MTRRRLSSDGYKLFRIAFPGPPSRIEKIKMMLSCLFHSEYDDKLDEMISTCAKASKQLYGYHSDPIKREQVPKFIDNSIFNVIYAIMCYDGALASKFQMRRNYRYFCDVMYNAFQIDDHNTVIMLRTALGHHSLEQLRFKKRKRDVEMLKRIEEEYGSWRNCYKRHFQNVMNKLDATILPSMMVLRMHLEKTKVHHPHDKIKKLDIEGTIGFYASRWTREQYNEALPLYEDPPIRSSTELIVLAKGVK